MTAYHARDYDYHAARAAGVLDGPAAYALSGHGRRTKEQLYPGSCKTPFSA